MDNGQQIPGSSLPADVRKMLMHLGLRYEYVARLVCMLKPREISEINSVLRTLNRNERKFVSKFVSRLAQNLGASVNDPGLSCHEILIACRIAHLMTSYLPSNYMADTAYHLAKRVANSAKYVLKFPADKLEWSNREVLAITHGIALTVIADREGETSFENVVWLGENYPKLLPLIPMMIEVSCERGYLELLLANDAPALGKGVL